MKTLVKLIVFLFTITVSNAQETAGQTITVTVDNISNTNGKVMISLHTSETFMKGPGIQNAESKIKNGTVSVTFNNVVPGTYAIMALHDENENNRMDFEDTGMPKEAFGSSNNPMNFGPPQFVDSKFEVAQEVLDIKITF